MRKKICLVCGKEFTPESGNQKMCSPECSEQRKRDMAKRYGFKSHENEKAMKARVEYERRYCNGHLNKKLAECKRRGISYGQLQTEKYCERITI